MVEFVLRMRDPLKELIGTLRWESRRIIGIRPNGFKRLASKDPCAYCGRYRRRMNWDHIIAYKEGGRDLNNLTRCCKKCNLKKGHTPLLIFLGQKHQKWWALHMKNRTDGLGVA